jgi:hypothetical protein
MSDILDSDPIRFDLNNGAIPNTIYTTTTINALTFFLTNNDTVAATLTAAPKLVPKSQAGSASGSLFYLDFSGIMMTATNFSALVAAFTAPNWQFGANDASDSNDRTVCMSPTQTISLPAGGMIIINITGLALSLSQLSATASLTLSCYRIAPFATSTLPVVTHQLISLQTPPDEDKTDLASVVQIDVLSDFIVSSLQPDFPNVPNSITLRLRPSNHPQKVPVTTSTVFTISFIYDDTTSPGYNALTTVALAMPDSTGNNGFSVNPIPGITGWQVNPPTTGQQTPTWELQPTQPGNLLGADGKLILEFVISNIITYFQAGPTVMVVSYSGIDGFADGAQFIPLQKIAHVTLQVTDPAPVTLTNGSAQVNLNWVATASDPNDLTLTLTWIDGIGFHSEDVTGKSSIGVNITETTCFNLTATAHKKGMNTVTKSINAVVTPVLVSFTTTPAGTYYNDPLRNVTLNWNINTNQEVTFPGLQSQFYKAAGHLATSLTPGTITLETKSGDLSATCNFSRLKLEVDVINVDSIADTQSATDYPAANIAAMAPSGNYMTLLPGDGGVTPPALCLLQGTPTMSSIQIPGSFTAAMAFSPDGTLLYCVDVSSNLIVNAVGGSSSVPTFTQLASINSSVNVAPQAVVISPSGKFIYVLLTGQDPTSNVLLVYQNSGTSGPNQFTIFTVFALSAVGTNIVITADGKKLFVAYTDIDTIAIINIDEQGTPTLGNSLSITRPLGLAITPDGKNLLVALSNSKRVTAINISNPLFQQFVMVSSPPQQITMDITGRYAIITHSTTDLSTGFISLISYDSLTQQCNLVENCMPIPQVWGLYNIVLSPNGTCYAFQPGPNYDSAPKIFISLQFVPQ